MKDLITFFNFFSLFIRKTFQILLSLLIIAFLALYIYQLHSCFSSETSCYPKSNDRTYLFDGIFYSVMIFIFSFWGYFLYKSYRAPFTWKLFFIHLTGILVFISVVPTIFNMLTASEVYQKQSKSCMDILSDNTYLPPNDTKSTN